MFERIDDFYPPAQQRISAAVIVKMSENTGTSGLSLIIAPILIFESMEKFLKLRSIPSDFKLLKAF